MIRGVRLVAELCCQEQRGGEEGHAIGVLSRSGEALLRLSSGEALWRGLESLGTAGEGESHSSRRTGRNDNDGEGQTGWVDSALRRARLMLKGARGGGGGGGKRVLLFVCSPVTDGGEAACTAGRCLAADCIDLDILTFGDAGAKRLSSQQSFPPARPIFSHLLHAFAGSGISLKGGIWRFPPGSDYYSREIDVIGGQRPAASKAREKNVRLFLSSAPSEWRSALLRLARPMRRDASEGEEKAARVPSLSLTPTSSDPSLSRAGITGCRGSSRMNVRVSREFALLKPVLKALTLKDIRENGGVDSITEAGTFKGGDPGKKRRPLPKNVLGRVGGIGIKFEREKVSASDLDVVRILSMILKEGVLESAICSAAGAGKHEGAVDGNDFDVLQLLPCFAGRAEFPQKLLAGEQGILSIVHKRLCENSQPLTYLVFRPKSRKPPTSVSVVLPYATACAQPIKTSDSSSICAIQITCVPILSDRASMISGNKTCNFFFQGLAHGRNDSGTTSRDASQLCDAMNTIFRSRKDAEMTAPLDMASKLELLLDDGTDTADLWGLTYSPAAAQVENGGDPEVPFVMEEAERLLAAGMDGAGMLSMTIQALWSVSSGENARIAGGGLIPVHSRKGVSSINVDNNELVAMIPSSSASIATRGESFDSSKLGWITANNTGDNPWGIVLNNGLQKCQQYGVTVENAFREAPNDSLVSDLATAANEHKTPSMGRGAGAQPQLSCSALLSSSTESQQDCSESADVPENNDSVGEGGGTEDSVPSKSLPPEEKTLTLQSLQELLKKCSS